MPNKDFFDYYNLGREKDRYTRCSFEFERTKDILVRNIDFNKKSVLDMGGGAGYYSFWLAKMGLSVHLRDIVPLHIQQAREEEQKTGVKLGSIDVGDATNIEFDDKSFDYVLLFGPLYHIQSYEERRKVLIEAKRVLKDDGKIFAVFIHKNSAIMDFIKVKEVDDKKFKESALEALKTGCFNNRYNNHFTFGYFHTANEFKNEVETTGLKCKKIINVEGINRIVDRFDEKINSKEYLDNYLEIMREIECDSSMFGVSSHLLSIITK
ncbi:class I SAM-dependent methyltransferase [Sedimentibacter sp. zth1]|uniref:class I SAM-dependent methyltransferase n=1 Tax=Sedimentibacter sp. zth1 TaxID=2816908 RepID=UPI001A912F1C|nr:class I SAM-dependent methyltransferase [Sedimentibacter sp. zth1]QSX04706.1 class I SAM-dependent methyltransferase [Sedimentibacter sp. zth1]